MLWEMAVSGHRQCLCFMGGAAERTSFEFPQSREHSTAIMGGVFGSSAWVPVSLNQECDDGQVIQALRALVPHL